MSTKRTLPTRLAVLAAGATTYYVSPSGSDSNNGTSPTIPIKTLGRASGLCRNPGDQVLLGRGATFPGKLAVWRSGTAAAPTTIGAYGSGNDPIVTGDCLEVGDGRKVGVDGNGDGRRGTDIGAFEAKPRHHKGKGHQGKGHQGKGHHNHHNQGTAVFHAHGRLE